MEGGADEGELERTRGEAAAAAAAGDVEEGDEGCSAPPPPAAAGTRSVGGGGELVRLESGRSLDEGSSEAETSPGAELR